MTLETQLYLAENELHFRMKADSLRRKMVLGKDLKLDEYKFLIAFEARSLLLQDMTGEGKDQV